MSGLERDALVNTIFKYYNYFFCKKYTGSNGLPRTSTNLKYCNSFVDLLQKDFSGSIGNDFLYRYFLFQFNYWEDIGLENNAGYNNRIQFTFIIGKKAFDRYKKRNTDFDWRIDSYPIINKYGLRKEDLIEQPATRQKIVVVENLDVDTEAPIKVPFYNTQEGYNVCGIYSTLYNHRSPLCIECIFKNDCKKRLQQTYPTLYERRGYK